MTDTRASNHADAPDELDDDPEDGQIDRKSSSSPPPRRPSLRSPPILNPLDGRVALRTLILIRWIAIAGQLASVLLVHFVLEYALPIGPALAAVGASVALNAVAMAQRAGRPRLADRDAALYLGYDTLQLTLLLYLTGGLSNPFSVLLLAPVTVSASVLARRSVLTLTLLNQCCITVLALWHFPLPWPSHQDPIQDPLYSFGVWFALSLSSLFIAAYVFRVADEARRINEALNATQLALAREQRVSALGALAAAAAHELGTPLGTIVVVAKELSHDIPADSPWAEDIALLQSQAMRCRQILADLARKPEAEGGTPFDCLPLTALVEQAAASHRMAGILLDIRPAGPAGEPEPVVCRSPELMHGLGNLLQNALQFATRRVTVTAGWDHQTVSLTIIDDGPGFPSQLLGRIGEPYISQRAEKGAHMGLGIFIAQTLLQRTGASVEFGNNRSGGARVVLVWNRVILEAEGSTGAA
ncbi:MAG TPA: ActS/PrrB/RegB family redox-sensitive histidine kinase [Azospirillaceae bacterium]|nr:ActS/PrrB/RegB family redox-sensitive histidine kinase [Azospirillaceae bacterium]